jgi:hypothetical protein
LHDQDNSVPTLGGDASGEIRLRYELKMWSEEQERVEDKGEWEKAAYGEFVHAQAANQPLVVEGEENDEEAFDIEQDDAPFFKFP